MQELTGDIKTAPGNQSMAWAWKLRRELIAKTTQILKKFRDDHRGPEANCGKTVGDDPSFPHGFRTGK